MVDDMGFDPVRLDKGSALHLSLGRGFGQRRYRASDLNHFSQISKVIIPKLLDLFGQRARRVAAKPASLKQRFIDRCSAMSKPISERVRPKSPHAYCPGPFEPLYWLAFRDLNSHGQSASPLALPQIEHYVPK